MTIRIEQLDASGNVYRTFTRYPKNEQDIMRILSSIERAYNMSRTVVTVVGV